MRTLKKLKAIFSSLNQKRKNLAEKMLIPFRSERAQKIIQFCNKFAMLMHVILACVIVFIVEWVSRRSFTSAIGFLDEHTMAFIYNAFIVFASLSLVFIFKRRSFFRIFISAFWLLLGTTNGVILSNRVTPFGYTDLKLINDLLSMQTSSYLSATESTIIVVSLLVFLAFLIYFFIKGPKYQGKIHFFLAPVLIAVLFALLPVTTKAAQESNIIAAYFGNIAEGYSDYGFIYGFSSSVVGVGMSTPNGYSEAVIDDVLSKVEVEETTLDTENAPNIIVVLLESFIDPYEVNFLELSEDPIPNFHYLYDNYTSGHLTVPVVGAGTANTEFEVLTGMNMQYFGTGEYPYKTVYKEIDSVESVASVLSTLGYGTHAVHNNGGNFYSRANAFSLMGFDTFTSKEMMNIQEYTPLRNWPTDHILVSETEKALDSTEDQSDFVYTITVQGHGAYPEYQVLDNPTIQVSGADTEEENYQWEYYINMIHEVDNFIGDLIDMVNERDEDTIIVFFGDHLPTMNLEEEDMATGDLFQTKYVTYNNFGLAKEDADLTAYELMPTILDQLGIHEGTIMTYTQSQMDSIDYLSGLQLLQYDLLYGSQYAYDGEDPYPATEIEMGVEDVTLDRLWISVDDEYLCLRGSNFTAWSRVYINGEKVSTQFVSSNLLQVKLSNIDLQDGDEIVVQQMGSSNTVFRASNSLTWEEPELETETEGTTETESTESKSTETESSSDSSSSTTDEEAE